MTAVYLTMFLIVVLALGVGGVVAIGMKGAMSQKAPKLASGFAEAARHMNGEGEPPKALVELLPEQLVASRH